MKKQTKKNAPVTATQMKQELSVDQLRIIVGGQAQPKEELRK